MIICLPWAMRESYARGADVSMPRQGLGWALPRVRNEPGGPDPTVLTLNVRHGLGVDDRRICRASPIPSRHSRRTHCSAPNVTFGQSTYIKAYSRNTDRRGQQEIVPFAPFPSDM